MSPQLEVAKLDLNRLSCDLPDSVLNWDHNPDMGTGDLSLLMGNLYHCPPTHGFLNAILAPTLGHDTSLYKHDATGGTYECGVQAWYYPLIESTVAILALAAALAHTWREQRCAIVLREQYWRRRGRFWSEVDLGTATTNLAALASSSVFVSLIAVVAMLPLYLASGSRYTCQGSMEGSLGYKHLSDDRVDAAMGAAVGMAAVVGLGVAWWGATASKAALARDALDEASDKEGLLEDETTGRRDDVLVDDDRLLFVEGAVEGAVVDESVEGAAEGAAEGAVEGAVEGEEDAEDDFDRDTAERRNNVLTKREGRCDRLPTCRAIVAGLAQLLVPAMMLLGSNVGYVLVTTATTVPTQWKSFATFGMTLVKVATTKVLIPHISTHRAFAGGDRWRFHRRINAATVLSAIAFVVVPIGTGA